MRHSGINTLTSALTLIALTGSAARADIFNWWGGPGLWSDHLAWNGPANAYPDSILDSATVQGASTNIEMDVNVAVGQLRVLHGADVRSSGHSLFVNGDVLLDGLQSTLTVSQTSALRDLDCDTLDLAGGLLVMYGGLAQFDTAVLVADGGRILGEGVIEMNSTSGNLDLADGLLQADGVDLDATGVIRVQRTGSSTSRLDWTSPDGVLAAWHGGTLELDIPFAGALGGRVTASGISKSSTITSTNGFVTQPGSQLTLRGGDIHASEQGSIVAPAIDHYGELFVQGATSIDVPVLALRGSGEMNADADLLVDTTLLILDSFDLQQGDGPGAQVQFFGQDARISVTGGVTTIALGAGGRFDLDGAFGTQEISVADGASLVINTEKIDGGNDIFDGTMGIEGALSLASFGNPATDEWINNGVITMEQGVIAQRRLRNTGSIIGSGTISTTLINEGLLEAQGGALFLADLDMDGGDPASAVIRAVDGEIAVLAPASNLVEVCRSPISVGNGAGVREVFEMNRPLRLDVDGDSAALLTLNSGLLRAKSVINGALIESSGESELRASGQGGLDMIWFTSSSTTTASGQLDLMGRVQIDAGAHFDGGGTIRAIHSGHATNLGHGADLSAISLEIAGGLGVATGGVGEAHVGDLTLFSTSSTAMHLAGDNPDTDHDAIVSDGLVSLDGELTLGFGDDMTVPYGTTVTIIEAQSVVGEFVSIDASGLGAGYRAFVRTFPDRVEVFVTCLADLSGDGGLNFFDVSAFLAAFNAQEDIADLNEDGSWNFFDVSLYLSAFDAGC